MRRMVSSLLTNSGVFSPVRRWLRQPADCPNHLQWRRRVQSAGVVSGAILLALAATEPAAYAQRFEFAYTGRLVTFKVPIDGGYQIVAFGAQGGNISVSGVVGPGGRGAAISGDFSLTAGENLQIAVGGVGGSSGPGGGAAGGGGSFVVAPGNKPLVVAGGGGGGGLEINPHPPPGGPTIIGGLPGGGGVTASGNGNGGEGGIELPGGGAGGGGFLSAGGCGSPDCSTSTGGAAFPDLAGGVPGGGFGGGGGAGFLPIAGWQRWRWRWLQRR